MSQLLEKVKADLLQARKDKHKEKSSCLSTLVGECMTKQKSAPVDQPFTDTDTQAVLKKTVKNVNACLEANLSAETRKAYEEELGWLTAYMPKLLSDTEVTQIISDFKGANAGANLGSFMGHMKKNHAGLYDAQQARHLFENN